MREIRASSRSSGTPALLFLGNPTVALLLATLVAFWWLGHRRGVALETQTKWLNAAIASIAVILLIITAGGVFKQVLVDSGVGARIASLSRRPRRMPMSGTRVAWAAGTAVAVCREGSTAGSRAPAASP